MLDLDNISDAEMDRLRAVNEIQLLALVKLISSIRYEDIPVLQNNQKTFIKNLESLPDDYGEGWVEMEKDIRFYQLVETKLAGALCSMPEGVPEQFRHFVGLRKWLSDASKVGHISFPGVFDAIDSVLPPSEDEVIPLFGKDGPERPDGLT